MGGRIAVLVVVFFAWLVCYSCAQCPRECFCHAINQERTQHSVICRGRNLRFIPGSIPLTTIHLDLGDNLISQLSVGDFDGLHKLLNLYLQNNRISRIAPGTFRHLENLKVLDIYDNNIRTLQNGTFEGLAKLRQLDAYNINLRSIEDGTFSPLQSATIVNLDQNLMNQLQTGTFKDLPFLTRLSIRGNAIEVVREKALDNLPRLAYLHLGSNRIRTLEENAFHRVNGLRALFLDENDYSCDCESLWLWELLLRRPSLGQGPRCSRPFALLFSTLRQIVREDQLCPQPQVHISLSQRYVFLGDTVNLQCTSDGILRPSLHWSLNGKRVSVRKGFSIESDKLVIRNITFGLQGNYYCIASGMDGGVAANGIEVFLSGLGIDAPTFDSGDTILRTVFEGENVELLCDPRLDTTEGLNISWSRTDALPLPAGHVITAENSLMLLNVMTSDEATYRCTAVNVLGSALLDYQLDVELPVASRAPVIDKTNGSLLLTFSRGQRGLINCFVNSESDFTIDWFLNGWPIRDALFTTEFMLDNNRQTLVVTNADVRSIGDYMCLVRNEAGTDRLVAKVDVTVDPYFERQPSDVGVPPTKSAQFYCSAGGNPEPTIQWFFVSNKTGEERQVTTSGEVYVSDERLIILHARSSDEGYYYCRATSEGQAITSKRVFLTVYSTPVFTTNLPTEVNAEELERVDLPCTASGTPRPDVTWTRAGVVVGEGEGTRVQTLPSGTLVIENGARDDGGLYTCRVANAAGEQFHEVQLNILRRPVVQLSPERLLVEVDDPVRFVCIADGAPPPETTWLFQGNPITENDRVVITRSGDLLLAAAKAWDEGYYSCLARNKIGQSEDRALLQVVGFIGNTTAPVIRQDFITRNVSRNTGDELTVSCLIAAGAPPPTLQWLRGSTVLQQTPRIKIDPVGLLKIFDIRNEDAGHYTCIARNTEAVVQSTTTLLVRELPEVNLPPVTPHVDPGSAIELTCQASGSPPPRIQWLYNNGAIISDGENVIIEGSQLIINNAQQRHTGEYTCLAINEAGQSSHSIKVSVTENSEPSFDVRPTSQIILVGEPLLLDCRVKGTPEITVEWRKNGELLDAGLIDVFAGNLRSVNIDKATEEDSGRYSCYAFNNFGTAESEVEVFVTNDEGCIPNPTDSPRTATGLPTVNRTLPTGETAPQLGSLHPIYNGNQVRAAAGHTVVLNCTQSVAEDDLLNHVWLHNNVDIHVDDDRFESFENGTLVIKVVIAQDRGRYECLFSLNDAVTSNSFDVSVSTRVLTNVRFTIEPQNQTIIAGSTSVLICSATSDDQSLLVEWYFEDRLVSSSGVVVSMPTTLEHAGQYTCVLTTKEYSSSTFIFVHTPPAFTTRPVDVILSPDSSPSRVVLQCGTTGTPQPTLSWLRGNQSLQSNFNLRLGQLQLAESQPGSSSLIILPPFTEDLVGKFTCVAENSAGRVQASATVRVAPLVNAASTSKCECELKTRKRQIHFASCVSFTEHNENYCEGFCQTSIFPTYSAVENTRVCCTAGTDSVKSVILMRCRELGHAITRAVELDAVRSCRCHRC